MDELDEYLYLSYNLYAIEKTQKMLWVAHIAPKWKVLRNPEGVFLGWVA